MLFALIVAGAALGAKAASGPGTLPTVSWEDYHLILDRNIFAKDRTSPSRGRESASRPAEASGSGQMVLTGVALRGDARTAFFEDSRTGQTVKAAVGKSLGEGTIISISLDAVEYRIAGSTRKIAIGQNLSGTAGTLYAASSQPATQGTPLADEVAERMRQRRLQELK